MHIMSIQGDSSHLEGSRPLPTTRVRAKTTWMTPPRPRTRSSRYRGRVSRDRDLRSLETDRLLLRRSRAEDATVVRNLWTERDHRVPLHRHLDAEGRPTIGDIARDLEAKRTQVGLALLSVIRRDTDTVIGYCGLTANGNGSVDEPELAFELSRAEHGNGFATEAAQAVVDWADAAGYPRLWAGVWEWNTASRRVLAKVGFAEAGESGPRSAHGANLLTMRERALGTNATNGRQQ